MENKLGLVHIYCGDGKGKTTASIGLTIRALGSGLKVLFVQFLKNGSSSEVRVIESLKYVKYLAYKKLPTFSFKMTEIQKIESQKAYLEIFAEATNLCEKGRYDLVILDEVLGAINCGLFDEKLLLKWLENRPRDLEIVLTGRNPSEFLIAQADYVSEITKVKHPFEKGVAARVGIEK